MKVRTYNKKIFDQGAILIHNGIAMDKNKKPTTSKSASFSEKVSKIAAPILKKSQNSSTKKEPKKIEPSPINIPFEDIATRAYFISERRRELGWSGTPESDWCDAEKQLYAEALEGSTKK